jgi:hypothetical protein
MDDECTKFVKEIHKKFGVGTFEFFHSRRNIPEYTLGTHRRLHKDGYIEVKGYSGKARLYGLTDKSLKLVEVIA